MCDDVPERGLIVGVDHRVGSVPVVGRRSVAK